MENVWKTLDGSIFADKATARLHELDMIRVKERKLQQMKQKDLPLAQRDYDRARKELADFFKDLHHGRMCPRIRCHKAFKYEMLASLYRHLSSSYATLQERKDFYKKVKFELIQLKQSMNGDQK